METALAIYLSDMPEAEKIALIRAEFIPMAVMLDSMTGSNIVQDWASDDLTIDAAFVNAGWL